MSIESTTDTYLITHFLSHSEGLGSREHELSAPMFVAVEPAVTYDAPQQTAGFWRCALHTAWTVEDGELVPCFVERGEWFPSRGYCGSGFNDEVMTISQGVERLVRVGALAGLFAERPSAEQLEQLEGAA